MSEFLNEVLSSDMRPVVDVTTTSTIVTYNDPNEPPKKKVRCHYRYLGPCDKDFYLLNRYNGFKTLACISTSTKDFSFAEHLALSEVRAGLKIVGTSCEGVWYINVACLADRQADKPVDLAEVHSISGNPNPHLGEEKKRFCSLPGCPTRWVVLNQKIIMVEGRSTGSASLKDEFGVALNYSHPRNLVVNYNYFDLHRDDHKLYYYITATPGALARKKLPLGKSGSQDQIRVQVKHKFVFESKI